MLVQIDAPTWTLKQLCPCCGQGSPVVLACRKCGSLAAECQELGTFFRGVSGDLKLLRHDPPACANCGALGSKSFAAATSSQIQSAGLTKEQYE
jgi:hypothetical protein